MMDLVNYLVYLSFSVPVFQKYAWRFEHFYVKRNITYQTLIMKYQYGVELVAMLHEKNLSYSSQSTWNDWAVYTQEEYVWLPHNFK